MGVVRGGGITCRNLGVCRIGVRRGSCGGSRGGSLLIGHLCSFARCSGDLVSRDIIFYGFVDCFIGS